MIIFIHRAITLLCVLETTFAFLLTRQNYQRCVLYVPQRSSPKLFLSDVPENSYENDEVLSEPELSDEELEATMEEWDDRVARFNTVHLTGRIGNDPEPRYFDDGKVVVNLSLATQRKYHSADRVANDIKFGEEGTDWYSLEIWGQTAEFVSRYVDKGCRVGVIGSLQIDDWIDKETNEPRNRVKVIVRDFDILETRAESELRKANRRGPSFGDDDDDDEYSGPSSAGSGGFF